ncbi:MAG: homoserine O-succinyltransferase [bacterium]|nr:homoserine O-succinyltransferase [bacterium]
MTLIIDKKLPAYTYLEREQVLEMPTDEAEKQDIRPMEVGILNLMPSAVVERTEVQHLRLLANTPLQIRPTFIYFDTHKSRSKQDHFNEFYKTISEVKKAGLDGLILTGANLEDRAFEDVLYWKELVALMDWAHESVTSTIYSCWSAQAKLYQKYGIPPHKYQKKVFGIFEHQVLHKRGSPFLAGMDDEVLIPQSRWRGAESKDFAGRDEFEILIESKDAGPIGSISAGQATKSADSPVVGPHMVAGRGGREIYVQGHPEYSRNDIADEYFRDKSAGIEINTPRNYFPGGDETKTPMRNWSANGQVFYSNWINWVYRTTNVDVKKPLMD